MGAEGCDNGRTLDGCDALGGVWLGPASACVEGQACFASMTELTPLQNQIQVHDLNNRGVVAGSNRIDKVADRATIWINGEGMTIEGKTSWEQTLRAASVNDSGLVAVDAITFVPIPFSAGPSPVGVAVATWRDGAYVDEHNFTVSNSTRAMNNTGQLIGFADFGTLFGLHYFVDGGQQVTMHGGSLWTNTALDINAHGEVLFSGQVGKDCGFICAGCPCYDEYRIWHDGTMGRTVASQGVVGGPDLHLTHLLDNGDAYGTEDGLRKVWRADECAYRIAGGSFADVNERGDVVSDDDLYRRGYQLELDELLPAGWTDVVSTHKTNLQGQVVVQAVTNGETLFAVLAVPLAPCAADCSPPAEDGLLRGDGRVNVDDLMAVVDAIGSADIACDVAPARRDGTFGDGDVDIDDLLETVNSFGFCP